MVVKVVSSWIRTPRNTLTFTLNSESSIYPTCLILELGENYSIWRKAKHGHTDNAQKDLWTSYRLIFIFNIAWIFYRKHLWALFKIQVQIIQFMEDRNCQITMKVNLIIKLSSPFLIQLVNFKCIFYWWLFQSFIPIQILIPIQLIFTF